MHHGVAPCEPARWSWMSSFLPGSRWRMLLTTRSLGWQWSDQLVVSSPISLKNMRSKWLRFIFPNNFSGENLQKICWNYHPVIWLSQGSFSKIHVTRWRNEGQQSTKAYLKQLCLVGRLASINVFLSQVAPKQVPKQTIAFTRTWPLSSLLNGSQIVSDTNKIPNFKIICIKGK